MNKLILAVLLVSCFTGCWAGDESDPVQVELEASILKSQKVFLQQELVARQAAKKKFDEIIARQTKSGNLDAALNTRDRGDKNNARIGEIEAALTPTSPFNPAKPVAASPDAAKSVAGVYLGDHGSWKGQVTLAPDGTFKVPVIKGGAGTGKWELVGKVLSLKWDNWPVEKLNLGADGKFYDSAKKAILTRQEDLIKTQE